MTEKEAEKMTPEKAQNLPWDYPAMIFVPGRYYVGLWNMPLPPCREKPRGGDLLILVWRYDSAPEEWIVTLRIRENKDDRIWDSDDVKTWKSMKIVETEEMMLRGIEYTMQQIAFGLGMVELPPIGKLMIQGDCEKALQKIMASNKSWMHLKVKGSN